MQPGRGLARTVSLRGLGWEGNVGTWGQAQLCLSCVALLLAEGVTPRKGPESPEGWPSCVGSGRGCGPGPSLFPASQTPELSQPPAAAADVRAGAGEATSGSGALRRRRAAWWRPGGGDVASVGGPAGLTHRELIAEQNGPSCSQSLGDIPVLVQTGARRGKEGEVSVRQAFWPGELPRRGCLRLQDGTMQRAWAWPSPGPAVLPGPGECLGDRALPC